jgi:hypothetical protein
VRSVLLAAICAAAVISGPSSLDASEPGFRLLKLSGVTAQWQKPATEGGIRLTWALVQTRSDLAGARNCPVMDPLGPALEKQGVDPERLRAEIAAATTMWQAVAAVTFTEVDDPAKADIVIGAQATPRGRAFADVMLASEPDRPSRVDIARLSIVSRPTPNETVRAPIAKAGICLNAEHRWKIGFDGDLDAYDLRYTMAHEFGHALGLDHPSAAGRLMSFRYDEQIYGLTADDIAGAVRLYGPSTGRTGMRGVALGSSAADRNPAD